MIEDLGRFRQRFEFWQQWHPYVLRCKQLAGPEAIWSAIVIDIASSLVAAEEMRATKASDVVDELRLDGEVTADILSRAIGDRVDHVGFRIYNPLDVYLEILPTWAESVGWDLVGTKRFAPSARFQERVGSSAEMAQVWLQTPDAPVQLELFDMHQPLGGDIVTLGNLATDLLSKHGPYPRPGSWEPFQTDEIWHYGVLLRSTADVSTVHRTLSEATDGRHDLNLPYDDIVVNSWHGSHHTRVAHIGARVEIEFLSYIQDWGGDD